MVPDSYGGTLNPAFDDTMAPRQLALPGARGRQASLFVTLEAVERTDGEDVASG